MGLAGNNSNVSYFLISSGIRNDRAGICCEFVISPSYSQLFQYGEGSDIF
jgi:hypothetical protein